MDQWTPTIQIIVLPTKDPSFSPMQMLSLCFSETTVWFDVPCAKAQVEEEEEEEDLVEIRQEVT